MKTHLKVHPLPMLADMIADRVGVKVSVSTNDPRYTKPGRGVRNVVVDWGTHTPEDHEKELTEWCAQPIQKVIHHVQTAS